MTGSENQTSFIALLCRSRDRDRQMVAALVISSGTTVLSSSISVPHQWNEAPGERLPAHNQGAGDATSWRLPLRANPIQRQHGTARALLPLRDVPARDRQRLCRLVLGRPDGRFLGGRGPGHAPLVAAGEPQLL
jgi:hypothetical protein